MQRLAVDRMARAAQRLNMQVETNPNRYRRWYYRPDDEVSNRTYIQNSWHRTDAMREAALARHEAVRRSAEIQKSSNNLKLLPLRIPAISREVPNCVRLEPICMFVFTVA